MSVAWQPTAAEYDAMCADEAARPDGYFTGGWRITPVKTPWWASTRYEFRLTPHDPLTWHFDGLQARPDRHFISDGGSVPRSVQVIPALQKDRYWRSYAFHDSAYQHGGWYVRQADGAWKLVQLTRREADDWLYRMLLAEGATRATAAVVWGAVRAFGWAAWSCNTRP